MLKSTHFFLRIRQVFFLAFSAAECYTFLYQHRDALPEGRMTMKRETVRRTLRAAAVLLALFLLCLLLYALRPPCLILSSTGYYCAGCGTQRMIASLLQGDFPGAFRQNPLMFFLLPLAGIYAAAEAVRYVGKKCPLWKSRAFLPVLLVLLFLSLLFTLLRNLPAFSFLAPLPTLS